jgi:hypothetical protein
VILFGCAHAHVSLPMCGWQRCFDCAARRWYRSFGDEPGPWITEPEILQEKKIICGGVEGHAVAISRHMR